MANYLERKVSRERVPLLRRNLRPGTGNHLIDARHLSSVGTFIGIPTAKNAGGRHFDCKNAAHSFAERKKGLAGSSPRMEGLQEKFAFEFSERGGLFRGDFVDAGSSFCLLGG